MADATFGSHEPIRVIRVLRDPDWRLKISDIIDFHQVMKTAKTMKLRDIETQSATLLRELLERVPFLKVASPRKGSPFSANALDRADQRVKVALGQRTWTLVVETRRLGQPREVRLAALELRNRLVHARGGRSQYGVLLAPFISEASAQICAEAGIGYADLAVNARLSFDQIFIETRGAGNPFREKRESRSLFTAKAGRILRVLLTPHLRPWKVTELHLAAGVSLGQVSNVRKLLVDGEWAVAQPGGMRLTKPEQLARAWQASYAPRPRARETAYTLLHGEALDSAMRTALAEAGSGAHAVLASYSAAQWLAPYARQATRYFYADAQGADVLKRHLGLQSVPSGENVVLLEPREDDVFSGRIEAAPGIWCAGLVQTWLDLSAAGERGAEAAEHLLSEKLLPAWKEAAA